MAAEICLADALTELLYERNDLNAASLKVARSLSSRDVEAAFAGYTQLARIARRRCWTSSNGWGSSCKRPNSMCRTSSRSWGRKTRWNRSTWRKK